jgi:tripartite-type tricarboxylate transporter receptor subunit TctC
MMKDRLLIDRRGLLSGIAATAAVAAAPARAQAPWPDRTVRIIVPYPAGGSIDVIFRILSERLKDRLSQNFVVENRAGAAGNVGIDAVAKSEPDGYTLGAATVGHFAINRYLFQRMPFDSERDLIAPSLSHELPNVAVVAAQHNPAKTLAEFIAWAKAKPDGITIGSPGPGTTPHLSGVLFAERTGIKAVHVSFRGAAQTIPAMLSGDVNFALDNLASYVATIQGGQMRPLAVTSATRWPTMPDVPTMKEAGVDDFVVTSWGAFVVPAATPRTVVNRLSTVMREFAADKALQERFLQAGARILASTPEEVAAFAAKERVMWKQMVDISGVKPQ